MRFDLNKMDLERVLAKFSACYSDSAPPQIEKKTEVAHLICILPAPSEALTNWFDFFLKRTPPNYRNSTFESLAHYSRKIQRIFCHQLLNFGISLLLHHKNQAINSRSSLSVKILGIFHWLGLRMWAAEYYVVYKWTIANEKNEGNEPHKFARFYSIEAVLWTQKTNTNSRCTFLITRY